MAGANRIWPTLSARWATAGVDWTAWSAATFLNVLAALAEQADDDDPLARERTRRRLGTPSADEPAGWGTLTVGQANRIVKAQG